MAQSFPFYWGLLLLALCTSTNAQCIGDISLAKYYTNGVVFQADTNSQVWGFTTTADCPVTVQQTCGGRLSDVKKTADFEPSSSQDDMLIWKLTLPPSASGTECTLEIAQGDMTTNLEIIYGDVWFCSGQSNMEWKMASIFNSTEEIAASADYTNIRMYHVGRATADTPQDDINAPEDWDGWYSAADSEKLTYFSAICFLYARYMTDQLGDSNKVFGLIESDWGGTRIEPWMSPESLETCNVPDNIDVDEPYNSNSYLYNAMIYPFLRHTIYGALWYQGESNAGWNNELYACTFYEMISDWRIKWSESGSDPNYPFGFVQLGNFIGEPGGVLVRWHQTNDDGVVDGSIFMAVAMDTYDDESFVHPRNKQIIGERLGISGGNAAYGLTQNPMNGPFPSMNFNISGILTLDYPTGAGITYDNSEISGFYACCVNYDDCDIVAGNWNKIVNENVSVDTTHCRIVVDYSTACPGTTASGIAYLWEDIAVEGMLAAPIYSNNEFRLPAAPWKTSV